MKFLKLLAYYSIPKCMYKILFTVSSRAGRASKAGGAITYERHKNKSYKMQFDILECETVFATKGHL